MKPFPTLCAACGNVSVSPIKKDYTIEIKHGGKLHTVHIENFEIPTCDVCSAEWFGPTEDSHITNVLKRMSADENT